MSAKAEELLLPVRHGYSPLDVNPVFICYRVVIWLVVFSMPGLYFSLRQRTVLILLITNPSPPILFNPPPFLFFPPPFLFFSNLYCLMNSTFLRILAVPSKTDFCKIPTLCDIPNFFKLHFNSLGMDPSSPLIIAAINVSLSHILAISNRSSEYLCSFSFPFRISSSSAGQTQPYVRTTFHIHLLHTSCIIPN